MAKHYRTCNLCEAICGLEIEVDDQQQVVSITGDKNDPFSRGHICPKAVALQDVYADPNRLRKPLRRKGDTWEEIGWEEAFSEVVSRIRDIQSRYGADAVGIYQGNPSIHNLGTMMNSPALVKALGTRNVYSATSTDQLPHHFASYFMFGHPLLLPVPDIDHTQYWLILGANPLASNGSMMTAPDVAKRLHDIQKRGGKVVVIDPRRTETAEKASEHFFIRPGTDVYLLMAMIQHLFAEGLVRPGRLAEFTYGFETLQQLTRDLTPERVAGVCGIDAEDIRRLAREFASAPSAVAYGRIGLSTTQFGGLCQWLVYALNILTGNLDRPGGHMFAQPAMDLLANARHSERYGRWRSRVRNLPEFLGELPVATLAEEILTPGDGQIRALITSCGNPVLSTPNGGQMDQVMEQLEFMVAIDIYLNETTRHAHIILPPATGLEASHYDITFHLLAIRNTAKYSPAIFPKAEGAKYDWEIYQELVHRLRGGQGPAETEAPEQKLNLGLMFGPYGLSLEQLEAHPHGVDLGPLQSCLPGRLAHPDKRVNLAPELLVKDAERALRALQEPESHPDFPFLLIGRRHLRDNNSWMHNTTRLMKGRNRCTVLIHPSDAKRLGVVDQQIVGVESAKGRVSLPAEVSEAILPGVVCMPHGYGHNRNGIRLDIATKYAGASINDLTDHELLDDLTGNAAFNNVRVRVIPRD